MTPAQGGSEPTTATAKVVAVVLNWNGFSDTVECVESLLRCDPAPAHVVIFDNGSLDRSAQRLQEWAAGRGIAFAAFPSAEAALASEAPTGTLVFIESAENLGYAGANNIALDYAIDRAGAEFVWILNNDVVVDERALGQALGVAQRDASVGIVGAQLLRHDEPETIQALGGGYIRPLLCHDTQLESGRKTQAERPEAIEVDHLIGASLLVRAEAARRVGPIDESYFLYREETDWCIRMRRDGWKLYCSTGSIVWHKQSRSIGFKSPQHDYYAVRNMLRLVKKFYPASLPTAFAYHASRALLPKIVRFEIARAAAVCHALLDFVTGVSGRPERYREEALVREYVAQPGLQPADAHDPRAERRATPRVQVEGSSIAS